MALRRCRECTTTFAVGLSACPHCQSTDHEEDSGTMPKITRHGGPSIAGARIVGGSWSDGATADAWPVEEEAAGVDATPTSAPAPAERGERSSAGSSSEPSPTKPASGRKKSETGRQKPARGTASRSTRSRTAEDSTAPSTATDGQKTDDSEGAED